LVNGTGSFFARGKMVCHCLLVETRDGPARIANQKRLRELVRDHANEVQVICAHDVSELESAQRTTQRPGVAPRRDPLSQR
jgi:hypothetical protein